MNKLPQPMVDDCGKASQLAGNKRLHKTSYPHLWHHMNAILRQYDRYESSCGNALLLWPSIISEELGAGLKKHYSNPIRSLAYIKDLRDSSLDCCPMCGSTFSSTLDHVLPKDVFPEWSIFSKNLVPACSCNTHKGVNFVGRRIVGERVLHPYYDRVLDFRLITCVLTPESVDYSQINVEIISCCPMCVKDYHAVQYHIDKVVAPNRIDKWIMARWAKIYREPRKVLNCLPRSTIANQADFERLISTFLEDQDNSYDSKNNWHSVLIHGILNSPGIIQCLYARHNHVITHGPI